MSPNDKSKAAFWWALLICVVVFMVYLLLRATPTEIAVSAGIEEAAKRLVEEQHFEK